MKRRFNSWAILPAAKSLFNKNKVTLAEIASAWSYGTIVVCVKDNGQFHFIAGASGSYSSIGEYHKVHHDQTQARIGFWLIVNEIRYSKDSNGQVVFDYAVPPKFTGTVSQGKNMVPSAGLHVFK